MTDPRPENPIPFRGRIHLLVPFDSWRLRLPLTGIDLGRTGLSAHMAGSSDTMMDAFHMLEEHSTYELQVAGSSADHDDVIAPPPIKARLIRRTKTASGLELHFIFETLDALLVAFIEQKLSERP